MKGGHDAIVLTRDRAYLASEFSRSVAAVADGAVWDAQRILDRAASAIHGRASGTLVLDVPEVAADLIRSWDGQRGALEDAGWTTSRQVEPWTTWRRKGGPKVHVAIASAIDQGNTPLFSAGDVPTETASALAWYASRMGAPWCMTGGVSGHMAIRAQNDRRGQGQQPYWGQSEAPRRHDDSRNGAGDLIWSRAPVQAEVDMGWVHGFDLNAARLAALGVAEVAWSRLQPTGAIPFDPARAGYWMVPASPLRRHRRLPPLIDFADVRGDLAWVTTPMMKHIARLGIEPGVVDSWTAPGRRMFRDLAEQWDRARLEADGMAGTARTRRAGAVKATYAQACGLMARPGGSIYRPDWYHTIMDWQRSTLLSHVERIGTRTGRRPLAIHTDCLWYASTHADPFDAAEELGIRVCRPGQPRRLGMFRVHSSKRTSEAFKRKAGKDVRAQG